MDNFYIESNLGLVRNRNEDDVEVFVKDDTILLAIADGMGGHPSGHIASKMVLKCLKIAFNSFETTIEKADAKKWLANVFESINNVINEESAKTPEYQGMGTTLVMALISPRYILIANVGDSRAYITTLDHKLMQITEDHTLVAELYRQGELSQEELEAHPNKNILMQAIGTEPEIVVDIFDLEGGTPHQILLCTDGLTDMVSNEKIEEILMLSNDLELVGKSLIAEANNNGGKDNISVALWTSGKERD
jgi:protein phosphatase